MGRNHNKFCAESTAHHFYYIIFFEIIKKYYVLIFEKSFWKFSKVSKNLENDIEGDGIWNPIENQGISNTISNDISLNVIFEIFWDFAQISKWFFENQNIIFLMN